MSTSKKPSKSFVDRLWELVKFSEAESKKAKHWNDLHNAIFGVKGKFVTLFPDQAERKRALKAAEIADIRKLIDALPESPTKDEPSRDEASGRILVRVPKSIHAALLSEAEAEDTSLNQLILAKLSLRLGSMV